MEGLATTQRHRDNDPRSARYDELVAAEAQAKATKKGMYSEKEYKERSVIDLADPKKAKSYAGALMRAKDLKAIVEHVFNGARFRLLVPSENCHITFSPDFLRCPQPTPSPGSKATKPAEPFGDQSKRHARLTLLQRSVEIVCTGVTNGGVITGTLYTGQGGQRRNYGYDLVSAGLASVDQRKIDYGEAPKDLVEAQMSAQNNKVGIWSIEQPTSAADIVPKNVTKFKEELATVQLSEIISGSHFYFRKVGDEAASAMDKSMHLFTENNGMNGSQCEDRPGKVVAALFDDGSGKAWYRAKILERGDRGRVRVLYIDHGNSSTVPIATHLRPLDMTLGTDRVPAVAKEAQLALTLTRSLSEEEGLEAAQRLQSMTWGKDLKARIHCEVDGKLQVTLLDGDTNINETLVSDGLARVAKQGMVDALSARMVDSNSMIKLAADLKVAQESARKTRIGMWRYGDIGDEDDDE
jgi:staphylococcal nuclease domain-containing protein 1